MHFSWFYFWPKIKYMKILKLVVVFLFLSSKIQSGFAQNEVPVKISIFNQGTNIPFTKLLTSPIHPGIQFGTEVWAKETQRVRLYPSINIGYLFHRNLYQAIYATIELGYDLKFDFGLNVKSAIGIGYMHTFRTGEEYQFKNGQFQIGNQKGNSKVIPSFSLGLGYRLQPDNLRSTEIFTMYQSWIQYPISPGFIPIMAHTNLHLGAKFYPFQADSYQK